MPFTISTCKSLFYFNHSFTFFFYRPNNLKEKIIELVLKEAEQYLGMSMTYSLFEFIKEKFDELLEEQPEAVDNIEIERLTIMEPQVRLIFH